MDGSGWLMPNPDGQHLPTGITAADVAVAVLVACTLPFGVTISKILGFRLCLPTVWRDCLVG